MMMNNEPTLRLRLNGEEVDVNRNTTELYQYTGNLASRSHIFVMTGEDDDSREGHAFFTIHPLYQPLLQFMVTHELPMHVNLDERHWDDNDEAAYQRAIDQAASHVQDGLDDELKGLLDG